MDLTLLKMRMIAKRILFALYFLFWAILILAAYALLIDEMYVGASMLVKIFGLITLPVTAATVLTLAITYFLNPSKRPGTKKNILIWLSPATLLIPFAIIYSLPNDLEKEQHHLQLSYIAWMCDCANWNIDIDNGAILPGDEMEKENVFIEPASELVALPDSIGYTGDVIELVGQFYKRKGFPEGYASQQPVEKARVFRYTSFKIRESHHQDAIMYMND